MGYILRLERSCCRKADPCSCLVSSSRLACLSPTVQVGGGAGAIPSCNRHPLFQSNTAVGMSEAEFEGEFCFGNPCRFYLEHNIRFCTTSIFLEGLALLISLTCHDRNHMFFYVKVDAPVET